MNLTFKRNGELKTVEFESYKGLFEAVITHGIKENEIESIHAGLIQFDGGLTGMLGFMADAFLKLENKETCKTETANFIFDLAPLTRCTNVAEYIEEVIDAAEQACGLSVEDFEIIWDTETCTTVEVTITGDPALLDAIYMQPEVLERESV